MKADIHPTYSETIFTCACGNVLKTKSTLGGEQHLDICSQCHPFFSGKGNRMVDTAGRIEKFRRRYAKAS